MFSDLSTYSHQSSVLSDAFEMASDRPVSLPSTNNGRVFDVQEDHRNLRAISPDRVSAMSSESETSVDNSEEAFVKKSRPRWRSLTAIKPQIFKGSRSRTSSAFQKWKANQRRPVPKLLIFAITATIASMLVILIPDLADALLTLICSVLTSLLVYYIIHLRSLIPPNNIDKTIASWGLSNYPTQSAAALPPDFSRDINVIPCHSHNDYWRHIPLYDALAAGCHSVEADVWLSGADLLVGHNKKSLTEDRTLESLYINPIVSILSSRNMPGEVTTTNETSSSSSSPSTTQLNGIFETSPTTPLILLIDMKTEGNSTFHAVLEHLEPFRSRGWLTHYNGEAVIPGLITVVGTGNTPFDLLVANSTYRDIFYDAPLEELWADTPIKDYQRPLMSEKYSANNSYYASVSFKNEIGDLWHGMLSPDQVLTIRAQIKAANSKGLRARYWDTPGWPVGRRDHVWDVLTREGVGALNVDDLEAAKERNWGG